MKRHHQLPSFNWYPFKRQRLVPFGRQLTFRDFCCVLGFGGGLFLFGDVRRGELCQSSIRDRDWLGASGRGVGGPTRDSLQVRRNSIVGTLLHRESWATVRTHLSTMRRVRLRWLWRWLPTSRRWLHCVPLVRCRRINSFYDRLREVLLVSPKRCWSSTKSLAQYNDIALPID